jgi:hypothetical protein
MARWIPLVTTYCARGAADLAVRDHLIVEMVDHDLRLLSDGMVVGFDIAPQLLLRPLQYPLNCNKYRQINYRLPNDVISRSITLPRVRALLAVSRKAK